MTTQAHNSPENHATYDRQVAWTTCNTQHKIYDLPSAIDTNKSEIDHVYEKIWSQ